MIVGPTLLCFSMVSTNEQACGCFLLRGPHLDGCVLPPPLIGAQRRAALPQCAQRLPLPFRHAGRPTACDCWRACDAGGYNSPTSRPSCRWTAFDSSTEQRYRAPDVCRVLLPPFAQRLHFWYTKLSPLRDALAAPAVLKADRQWPFAGSPACGYRVLEFGTVCGPKAKL